MSSTETLKEAERVMVVCNACRYCEGFCAVFQAMELRRTFSDQDLKLLANLCHNCRDCYYACQYAPPHEFSINVSKTMADLSLETYQEFSWPDFMKGLFRRNGAFTALISAVGMAIFLIAALMLKGPAGLFSTHTGEGAFYQVLPYGLIVFPISAIVVFLMYGVFLSIIRFWRDIGGKNDELMSPRANLQALWDALRLKYFDGGGDGCNYPDDRFSMVRRRYHHFVFYGFLLCLASTTIAAFYDHFLHWAAPYPFLSWPVLLGTAGGISMTIGTGGLLYLKPQVDKAPVSQRSFSLGISFLILLLLTNVTGLLLLLLRATPLMGTLLVVHIGLVVGLFITMPYGKFLHAVYRYVALVRHALEQSREK